MALTKRYVTVAGGGTHDGTSEANAFTWAEMITDLNTPRAGYKYLVKSGTYANGTTSTTITGDGSATSPNVIEGFNATEGDLYTQGRTTGGPLDTTNFPAISYTGTTARFDASGATHLTVRCLSVTSAASNPTYQAGTNNEINTCRVTNTGTNSASSAILGSIRLAAINNDVETAVSGGTYAIRTTAASGVHEGNRVKCPNGTGILVRDVVTVRANTIFECITGVSVDNTGSEPIIANNTIVNCTGDGIEIITGTTAVQSITGNHITGCGGWGIDFNTSTCQKRLGFNRFRDNTSGTINGGGDWEEGTSTQNVTSDDTDSLDFVDQSTDDYSLKAGAAATSKGIGYLIDIGAHGSPVVAGGGGSALHLGGLGQTGIGVF